MSRTRFVDHKGTQILYIDLSGFEKPKDGLPAIAEAKSFVDTQPENSLLTLTNVSGSGFDAEIAEALWDLLRHNKPYVRAGAVVGISSKEQDTLYHLLTHQTKRKLPAFDDVEQAKDWLVAQ